MNNILVIGSSAAPYHPIENVYSLKKILTDYDLTFTTEHNYLLRLDEYCMCICYIDSFRKPLNNEQSTSIKKYLADGGVFLFIHNGISIHDTPELSDIIGARFTHHPPYCKLYIKLKAGHPLTDGVSDFYILDEPYHFEISKELNILASYEYEGSLIPAAWERAYGNGKMLYLMLGHDKNAFECEEYKKLLKNSVKYLSQI